MTNAVILAGGKGTRLGPLAAQISKALVSIGQRPHLAHQVELLQSQGIDHIVVVVSPSTQEQVFNLLRRSGLDKWGVRVAVQQQALGPVDAIRVGLQSVEKVDEDTVVLMSDTYLEETLPRGTWVAEGPASFTRSFCFRDGDKFVDGTASRGKMVTIGAYRFEDTITAYKIASEVMLTSNPFAETGMAPFLTKMAEVTDLGRWTAVTWQDLGDVKSLALARQSKFIAREHHSLNLSDFGTITKTGHGEPFTRQQEWMWQVSHNSDPRVANLVPRVYSGGGASAYTMEYIDLPTLSELWLYWPGRPDTWASILETVMDRLEPLWGRDIERRDAFTGEEVSTLLVQKALDRLKQYDDKHGTSWLKKLSPRLLDSAWVFVSDEAVRPHGDLNFNNILFSLNTGAVKLVDPRGDTRLPLIYEFAKLRYSYHGGFSAITHGLYRPLRSTRHDTFLLPDRREEIEEMDKVLQLRYSLDELNVAEACLLAAGAVMHDKQEGEALLTRAYDMLGVDA